MECKLLKKENKFSYFSRSYSINMIIYQQLITQSSDKTMWNQQDDHVFHFLEHQLIFD